MAAERWYGDGLRFECSRCGKCCTGAPGYVWVTREETQAIASKMGLAVEEFRDAYVYREGSRYSLIERANGDCIFWNRESGCVVYDVRPAQCRTYPFWPESLKTRRAWAGVTKECPGVGHGRLYSLEEITRIRTNEAETGQL